MIPYQKPALTISQQIDLVIKRGLLVSDRNHAEKAFNQIGYYRLSPYFIPFETSRHQFKLGASFTDVANLYECDRLLRNYLDEALEIIEVGLRSRFANTLSLEFGVFCHEDPNNFFTNFNHEKWIERLHKEVKRSNEQFVVHYKKKYNSFPTLPIWMAVELMSFGVLSHLYKGLKNDRKIKLSNSIFLHHSVFESWLHTLTYIRNLCAHHSRLWNRQLAISPKIPKVWPQNINPKQMQVVLLLVNDLMRRLQIDPAFIQKWKIEIINIVNMQPIKKLAQINLSNCPVWG